ncbi:MAG: FxLYD domain-containing protein [Acidobacteriota bacterium]
MTTRRKWTVASLVAALALGAFMVPVAADWLVTRDGARIETEGPWKVESRLVIFKRPDGTLTSIRLSQVDLEASERLTEKRAAEKARAEQAGERDAGERTRERREPVLRLTEKELPPVGRRQPEPEAEAEGEPEAEGAGSAEDVSSESTQEGLRIATWREVTDPNSAGVEFDGVVRNTSDKQAIGVGVLVVLYDDQDEEVGRTAAAISSTALPPGESARFRATLPGVFAYDRAELTAQGQLLRTGEPAETAAGEGAEEEEEG